ncbi:MAG: Glu-tRNA(Gln) amidotransferase subunit GatD [Candidatus ainarchaeum sp.]|nr:Glu-tRNA(Gln) amidotransferase subunit GatD [Candidatus ainarchaeum sp.]
MNYIGKTVEIDFKNALKEDKIRGVVLPSSTEKVYIIKQKSGYNVGILKENIISIKEVKEKIEQVEIVKEKIVKQDSSKKKILICTIGGTIASKIDYNTGAVSAKFSSEDLLNLIPELKTLANIETHTYGQIMSEDLKNKNWEEVAQLIYTKHKDYDGIILTHGTDVLHYTSAVLSYMLEGVNIPVVVVGSQRSSDRPSADTTYNLLGAVKFITESKKGGVFVSMHSSSGDTEIDIIAGTRARKMHSSRRDAFRSINIEPVAKVVFDLRDISKAKVKFSDSYKLISSGKLEKPGKLSNDVYLLKFFPSQDPKIIDYLKKEGYKVIILEGTGLGHVSGDFIPQITKAKDVLFFMTTQTIYGRVNQNVYSRLRQIKDAGVIGLEDMTTEAAVMKAKYILGKYSKKEDIIREMTAPKALDVGSRTE